MAFWSDAGVKVTRPASSVPHTDSTESASEVPNAESSTTRASRWTFTRSRRKVAIVDASISALGKRR